MYPVVLRVVGSPVLRIFEDGTYLMHAEIARIVQLSLKKLPLLSF